MSPNETQLEMHFHDAMLDIYERAKRLKPPYHATRFLQMVSELRGTKAAVQLLETGDPSEGFTELFLRGKDNLKISVEYLVLTNPWRSLFTDDQLAIARKRLRDCECDLPPEDAGA